MTRTGRRLALATLVAAVLPISPAAAATWTPTTSGTSEDITAIEYQGADRFWFATGSGRIFKRVGGAFQQKLDASGAAVVFRDIEFQPGGQVGLAVGTNGGVYRSTNAGDNWSPIAVTLTSNATAVNDCVEPAPVPLGDADSVRFNSAGDRAWIMAGGSQIATSTGSTATVGQTWADANDAGADCKIDEDADDAFPVPGGTAVYFVSKSFGGVWFTANNLTSSAAEKSASAGNGFEKLRRIAGDPANPNRQWSAAPNGDGTSYFQRTEDGWNSADYFTIANPDRRAFGTGWDIDYAGGTVLSAGEGGMILLSTNGRDFFFDDAPGQTDDFHAASLASATAGAVGGTNGKLLVTANANVLPDVTAPTGTISGPTTVPAGQAATYTLNAADEGGSGLNGGSFAWSSAGLPNKSGNPISYTFPSPGFYTVRVSFADNAGNTAETSLSVQVVQGGPTITPVFTLTGPGNTATAVIVGSRIKVRMKGAIKLPAGVDKAAACTGKIRLKLKKGKRTMLNRTTPVKLKNGKCRFAKTVFLQRSKVGKTRRLKLKLRFLGNQVLKAGSTSKTLTIRK